MENKITFKIEGGEDVNIFAANGENVLELARKAGVTIDAPCSGNGTCGKCRVKITQGKQGDGSPGLWRLACKSVVSGDAEIFVPDIASAYMRKMHVEVIEPAGRRDGSYGLAVDIGTTSVSVLLVDLESGDTLAKATTGNGQLRYGADVINRIIEQQKPNGISKLQQAIAENTLIPLINSLCEATNVSRDNIVKMTVASNTTMNHLLLGVDAGSIRLEPYEPAFLEFEPYDTSSIGIALAPVAKMILAPNVGSYVGGDITAGVLSVWEQGYQGGEGAYFKRPEMSLLIDLGTNGEIVFGNEDFLMACACSAGPAFEGGDISSGMRAADGAIEACTIDKDSMEPNLSVIGGGKPVGICGSGLIDVVAELFRTGIINGKGKFNYGVMSESVFPGSKRICRDEYGIGAYVLVFAENSATNRDITITEVDIDNFIRAKGAIFSGIISLLTPLGFTPADISNVMVAGGIGSGINIKNAISIGMLPDLPEDRYSYIGNSSLDGACLMLISQDAAELVHEIAANTTYIDLSTQPGYMDEFIAACFLPHTDESLFPSERKY